MCVCACFNNLFNKKIFKTIHVKRRLNFFIEISMYIYISKCYFNR